MDNEIEELLKYSSPDNDDNSIQFILDARVTDQIEYLVRYNNPKYIYDEWVKVSDLTCYQKVLEFHDGKVPTNIVKRIRPETDKLIDKFVIYDVESINNEIMLKVHIPGTKGIVTQNVNELKDIYMDEIVEYYEKHCM